MTAKKSISAGGQVWLTQGGENVLNESRMELLDQIARTGSITQAGKAVGISYRTAWLTVDHLNGIDEVPLVERTTGGKSGGGTRLTPAGEKLLRMYRTLQEEHGIYMQRLREGIHDFDRFLRLTRKIALKTSARNQLFGVVESIRKDALNAVVVLRLKGKDRLMSQITVEGLESLGLKKGDEAYALIKANWISVSAGRPNGAGKGAATGAAKGAAKPAADKSSQDKARTWVEAAGENRLSGKIVSVKKGAGNAEVALRLAGGSSLTAMVPEGDLRELAPGRGRKESEGAAAIAIFKASNVILGVAR
jgi:molybdate transport system regulatory protein